MKRKTRYKQYRIEFHYEYKQHAVHTAKWNLPTDQYIKKRRKIENGNSFCTYLAFSFIFQSYFAVDTVDPGVEC